MIKTILFDLDGTLLLWINSYLGVAVSAAPFVYSSTLEITEKICLNSSLST